jgi:hypothetical protein
MIDEDDTWKAFGAAAGIAAGMAARKAMEASWRRRQGTDPPSNPASPDTTWSQAILWTIVSGVGIALARLAAERAAAGLFTRRVGHLPAELETRSD